MTYRSPQPTQQELLKLEQENFVLKQELELVKSLFNPEKVSNLEEQVLVLTKEKEQAENLLKSYLYQPKVIKEKDPMRFVPLIILLIAYLAVVAGFYGAVKYQR